MTMRAHFKVATGQIDPSQDNDGIFSRLPVSAGFLTSTGTTHASRTLMLKDLRLLLSASEPDADVDAY